MNLKKHKVAPYLWFAVKYNDTFILTIGLQNHKPKGGVIVGNSTWLLHCSFLCLKMTIVDYLFYSYFFFFLFSSHGVGINLTESYVMSPIPPKTCPAADLKNIYYLSKKYPWKYSFTGSSVVIALHVNQLNKATLLIGHVIYKSHDILVTVFISPGEMHAHSYLRCSGRQVDKDVSV